MRRSKLALGLLLAAVVMLFAAAGASAQCPCSGPAVPPSFGRPVMPYQFAQQPAVFAPMHSALVARLLPVRQVERPRLVGRLFLFRGCRGCR